MPEYTDLLPEAIDPSSIEEEIFESIQAHWPDWEPAEGNLEVWIIKALAFRLAELDETVVDVADEIFATYGRMRNIPRYDAAPAVTDTTWTMVDDAGYTIPAGTELTVARSGNDLVMFEVAEETVISNGSSTGSVPIVAQETGADNNGLTGPATLIDALSYVQTIELDNPTSSGIDEEDLGAYLNRLKARLEISTETPIVPKDFEVLTRTFLPYVGRAVARDGWNPVDSTDNNPRMLALAVTGQDGEPLTGPQKAEIQELLESRREVNFEVHVINADYTAIDVQIEFTPMPGYTVPLVRPAVENALALYLSPAEWGRSQVAGAAAEFVLQRHVRYLEIAAVIDRVPGVDYIDTLKIAKHGSALGTSNLTLTGAVPLTRPGDFT